MEVMEVSDNSLTSQSLEEQLEQIANISDPTERGNRLTEITSQLLPSRLTLFQEALDAADKIDNSLGQKIEVLLDFFRQLPIDDRLLTQKAWQIVKDKFENEQDKIRAIEVLAPHLSAYPDFYEDAISFVENLSQDSDRTKVLLALILQLPESRRVDEAKRLMGELLDFKVLIALAPQLSDYPELLEQALEIARNSNWAEVERWKLMAIFAAQLPHDQRIEELDNALKLLNNIGSSSKIDFFKAIISGFPEISPESFLQDTLNYVESFFPSDSYQREDAISVLAPTLSLYSSLVSQALAMLKESSNHRKTEILSIFVRYSSFQNNGLLQQILTIADEDIDDNKYGSFAESWYKLLKILIPQLALSNNSWFGTVLNLIQKIAAKFPREKASSEEITHYDEALTLLASQMNPTFSNYLQPLLEMAQQVSNRGQRAQILKSLLPLIPQSRYMEVLQQALEDAKDISPKQAPPSHSAFLMLQWEKNKEIRSQSRFKVLCTLLELAYLFPQSHQSERLQEALGIIQRYDDPERAKALVSISHKISSEDVDFIDQIFDACCQVNEPIWRAYTLLFANFIHKDKEVLQEILKIIYQILDRTLLDSPDEESVYRFGTDTFSVLISNFPDATHEILCQVCQASHQFKDNPKIYIKCLGRLICDLPSTDFDPVQTVFQFEKRFEEKERLQLLKALSFQAIYSQSVNIDNKISEILEESLAIISASFSDFENLGDREKESNFTTIIDLAPYLPNYPQLLDKALEILNHIQIQESKSISSHILAIASLATHLPSSSQVVKFQELLKIVDENKDDFARSSLLTELSKYLLDITEIIEDVLNILQNIPLGYFRNNYTLLSKLLQRLPDSLTNQAIDLLKKQNFQQSDTFTPFRQYFNLFDKQLFRAKPDKMREVLETSVKGDSFGLRCLVPVISISSFSLILEETLKLSDKISRVDVLVLLAWRFPEELAIALPTYEMSTALEVVKSDLLYGDANKTRFLSALASRLPSGIFSSALRIIVEKIKDTSYRVEALSNLAPYIPEQLFHAQIQINKEEPSEILQLLQSTCPDPSDKAEVLYSLIPYFPMNQVIDALDMIKEASQELLSKILLAIVYVAPELPIKLNQKILEMLADITDLTTEKNRTEILCRLALNLPKERKDQLVIVISLVKTIQDEAYRSQVLKVFAQRFWGNISQIDTTLTDINSAMVEIRNGFCLDYSKIKVNSVSPMYADEAYDLTKNLLRQSKFLGVEALIEISSSCWISSKTKSDALQEIRGLKHPYLQSHYLGQLIPHLDSQYVAEVLEIAQRIEEPYYSIKSIIVLACKFPEIRRETPERIRQIENLVQRIELFSMLAVEVPELLPEIVKTAKNIQQPLDRKQVLVALQPHLPVRIVREIDRDRKAGKRISEELWNRALKQLARSYREALKAGGLSNDESQDQDLLNLRDEINSLTNLLLLRDLEPPMVVGILGNWGGGKSYIMHLMQSHMVEIRSQQIEEKEAWAINSDDENLSPYVGHIYQIRFDAWSFAKSNLWASLMQTIFTELERQIKLEFELESLFKENNINPYEKSFESAQIWQVLYKANESDRAYFLKKVLPQQLNNLVDDLGKQQSLPTVEPNDGNLEELEKFRGEVTKTFSDILEEVKEVSLKKWVKKNLPQIIIFGLLIIVSLSLPAILSLISPTILPWLKETSHIIAGQISVFIVSLIPVFSKGKELWDKAKKWYQEATESVNAYKEEVLSKSNEVQNRLNKTEIDKLKKSLKKYENSIKEINEKREKLKSTINACHKSIKEVKKDLPENLYGSLQDYISARIQEGSYNQQLGIMHQVREDLMNLSRRLLPPPITSEEYLRKIDDLKKVFPRGPARVVVYVDDLDRCPPERVVDVLEAIQLLVKTPLFVAVLAIDERYIIRALEKQYAGVLSRRGRPSGEDYLEKIIQLPYRVRPMSESAIDSYLRSQVIIQDTATGGTKFSEVSRDEFNLLKKCCSQVDLSPRTLKRLTNVYKLFKIVCRTRGTKPDRKTQQAIIALLALSGRYTGLMREVIADIESCYEENRNIDNALISFFDKFFNRYSQPIDSYSKREFDKFKHDATEADLIPKDLKLSDITHETFNLVRSFSFLGDVGYAAND